MAGSALKWFHAYLMWNITARCIRLFIENISDKKSTRRKLQLFRYSNPFDMQIPFSFCADIWLYNIFFCEIKENEFILRFIIPDSIMCISLPVFSLLFVSHSFPFHIQDCNIIFGYTPKAGVGSFRLSSLFLEGRRKNIILRSRFAPQSKERGFTGT